MVNGNKIKPYVFSLKQSAKLVPYKEKYIDEGVQVEITAGLAGLPSDDESPEAMRLTETAYYGWFVVCNDRVVLAANKDQDTVWGNSEFTAWHPQYNGFMGIVAFTSTAGASLLPWTTTKRAVEKDSPIYKRAVAKMKRATNTYTTYTTRRKTNLEQAKIYERQAESKPIAQLPVRTTMSLPTITKAEVEYVNVGYPVRKTDLKKVAIALGDEDLSASKVGLKTFEYYLQRVAKR